MLFGFFGKPAGMAESGLVVLGVLGTKHFAAHFLKKSCKI